MKSSQILSSLESKEAPLTPPTILLPAAPEMTRSSLDTAPLSPIPEEKTDLLAASRRRVYQRSSRCTFGFLAYNHRQPSDTDSELDSANSADNKAEVLRASSEGARSP